MTSTKLRNDLACEPILQRKNYRLYTCWRYQRNRAAVRIILRNVYCVSTVLMIQEVKPKKYNYTKTSGVYQSIHLLAETVYPEAVASNEFGTLSIYRWLYIKLFDRLSHGVTLKIITRILPSFFPFPFELLSCTNLYEMGESRSCWGSKRSSFSCKRK